MTDIDEIARDKRLAPLIHSTKKPQQSVINRNVSYSIVSIRCRYTFYIRDHMCQHEQREQLHL
ncbi:hypothetical protein BCR33DRAFT_716571, partial [Rhizoclosmatium globosum]